MITFPCSRCKGTCQVHPLHAGRLHTCEHCGLILTIPGKPVRKPKQPQSRIGMAEVLIGGGAIGSLVALGLVVSAMGNRSAEAARPVQAEVAVPTAAAEVAQPAHPAKPAQAAQAPVAKAPVPVPAHSAPAPLEPVVVIVE